MIKHTNGWEIVKKLKPDEDKLPMKTGEWHQRGRSEIEISIPFYYFTFE